MCRPHVSGQRLAHKLWEAVRRWDMLLDAPALSAYKAAVEATDPDNQPLLKEVRALQAKLSRCSRRWGGGGGGGG